MLMIIDILDRMIQWVDTLRTKDDIDSVRTKILYEILEGFKVLPTHKLTYIEFERGSLEGAKQEVH
jgi:hypothetical protein